MRNKDIDLIRDSAVLLEKDHLQMARDLMQLAHDMRPEGKFIKKKLEAYNRGLGHVKKCELRLQKLVSSGEVSIIPAGFRCRTKIELAGKVKLKQASMPFDSGFFPPESIARILERGAVNLEYPDLSGDNHTVCVKYERNYDPIHGRGIRFERSTYEVINAISKSRDQADIHKYLDSTFGYYTLDISNVFVLAHYNWHQFASVEKSGGEYKVDKNIENINSILNKRINRMFEWCDSAKKIIFVFGEFQGYEYMMIDNDIYLLKEFSRLSSVLKDKFGDKGTIRNFSEVDSAEKMLKVLDE
ncbi:hypothetical protein [Microbulbifer variabilis]|uniref:hypothetical protein n=1 Tax=Microbulbifer variabilis TaxID=266805 RepID=UPI001CFD91F6|nr:hypothetical protein [Microbulbifer variabilis]